MADAVVHGGTDAQGVALHDFSTNRNSCGPCPLVVAALEQAHVAQYPDPSYCDLRAALAQLHGVSTQRIVVAGSASEFIHRITMHALRCGAKGVSFPPHHYGDYPHAARNWGLPTVERTDPGLCLHWACEPSSPLGVAEAVWPLWHSTSCQGWRVLDCAYAPLHLEVGSPLQLGGGDLDHVWQMWTPNKALGMTGIRAAYAIAPVTASADEVDAIRSLAPSWVVGAHGVCMLAAWTRPEVQVWLATSLRQLAQWKSTQLALCHQLGWQVVPGHLANYFVARWPDTFTPQAMQQRLQALRQQDIKLRDCASFGLPGHVRMGVLPPASQQALLQAWHAIEKE